MNIEASTPTALSRPTRMANVLRPFSLSPSKSRMLLASKMAPIKMELGIDSNTTSDVTVPV